MHLLDHISELRKRLLVSLIGVLLLFVLGIIFSQELINFLSIPLFQALPIQQQTLYFTGPMEVFLVNIKVAFFVGILGGAPLWIGQFWGFIKPALHKHEKKYLLPFAVASILLFFLGVFLCYSFVLPLALEFLIQIGLKVGQPMITFKEYLNLFMMMILGFGLVFEFPLLLVVLMFFELLSVKTLCKNRAYILLIILLISAFLTPPDPISQIGLTAPIYLMFELSIVIGKIFERQKR